MRKNFKLTSEIILALKSICKLDNVKWVDSNSGGKRFCFLISKEFINKNHQLFEEDEINRAYIQSYFKMITEFNPVSKKFIDKYNIKDGHISLLRDCWFDYWTIDDMGDLLVDIDTNIVGVVMLDFKRPFGNYDVLGDVCDALAMNDDELPELTDDENDNLVNSCITMVMNYLIEETFELNMQIKNKKRSYWTMERIFKKDTLLHKIFNYFI